MKYIVTHPGQAHFDEFMAICLLLAHASQPVRIYRRQPTVEEIYDNEIAVVDVGTTPFSEYHDGNPEGLSFLSRSESLNFEHHYDLEVPASFVLVAQHLGWDLEVAQAAFPWWTYRDTMDRKGPMVAAKEAGVTGDTRALMSGIEGQVLKMFSEQEVIPVTGIIYPLMAALGRGWVDTYEGFQASLRELDAKADLYPTGRGQSVYHGDLVVNPTAVDHLRAKMINEVGADIPVSAFKSPRGGWSLYRFNDDPRYNFNRLRDDPAASDVTFIHASGFLASVLDTASTERLLELVKMARVQTPETCEAPSFNLTASASGLTFDDGIRCFSCALSQVEVKNANGAVYLQYLGRHIRAHVTSPAFAELRAFGEWILAAQAAQS